MRPALVIDTSSAAVTAGIVDYDDPDVAVLAEHVSINSRGHGELLAPAIDISLHDASLTVADLVAVVAGTGPGPFTGLRVGLVTAAVIGDALGIPTYGVCSLDAIADALRDEPALLVATDARRKEVYWARYDRGVRLDGPHVSKPADVARDGLSAIAGAGAELYDFGPVVRPEPYPRVSGLGRCAARRVRDEEASEPLIPLYLRRPDAVEPARPKQVSQ